MGLLRGETTKGAPARAVRPLSLWRREWDSNPRYLLKHTAFRGQLLKPLGHLSVKQYNTCARRVQEMGVLAAATKCKQAKIARSSPP